MLELLHTKFKIIVVNDPNYSPFSTDNRVQYEEVVFLDETDRDLATSRHAVRVFDDERLVRSCILLANGGASGIHEHSAVIVRDSCIIAVGPFVASLAIPTLQLQWSTCVDWATCFGVYDCAEHDCFISHGELDVARLTREGGIEWQSSGADIFTNGFVILGNEVHVIDWNDQEYRFDIETGKEVKTS